MARSYVENLNEFCKSVQKRKIITNNDLEKLSLEAKKANFIFEGNFENLAIIKFNNTSLFFTFSHYFKLFRILIFLWNLKDILNF